MAIAIAMLECCDYRLWLWLEIVGVPLIFCLGAWRSLWPRTVALVVITTGFATLPVAVAAECGWACGFGCSFVCGLECNGAHCCCCYVAFCWFYFIREFVLFMLQLIGLPRYFLK